MHRFTELQIFSGLAGVLDLECSLLHCHHPLCTPWCDSKFWVNGPCKLLLSFCDRRSQFDWLVESQLAPILPALSEWYPFQSGRSVCRDKSTLTVFTSGPVYWNALCSVAFLFLALYKQQWKITSIGETLSVTFITCYAVIEAKNFFDWRQLPIMAPNHYLTTILPKRVDGLLGWISLQYVIPLHFFLHGAINNSMLELLVRDIDWGLSS